MDLYHSSIQIFSGHHHMCYLMILLVTGSSTEPAFFHAGCRPSHHVHLLQCLYLTYSSEWPSQHLHLTYSSERNAQHLHLIMQEPTITSKRPSTHIHQHDRTSLSFVKRLQHLHLTWQEPNPTPLSERHTLTSDLVGTKSYTLARMAPSPRLSYLVTDQVPPFSQRMAVSLVSDLVGTKSYTLTRMACTHI